MRIVSSFFAWRLACLFLILVMIGPFCITYIVAHHNLKISCSPVHSKIPSHQKWSNSDPPNPGGYTQTHETSFFAWRLAGLLSNMLLLTCLYHIYIVAHHNLKNSFRSIHSNICHIEYTRNLVHVVSSVFARRSTSWFILEYGCHRSLLTREYSATSQSQKFSPRYHLKVSRSPKSM